MAAAIWVCPGINPENDEIVESQTTTLAVQRDASDRAANNPISEPLLVEQPGIVSRPALTTQTVERAGLVVNERGTYCYSPGPGTRTRSAAQEARRRLAVYFQSKNKRKLSKRGKQCDIRWDIEIGRELVKRQLFGISRPDSDTDEEEVDPRLRLPEEEEILFKEQVDNLKVGLSDKVVEIVQAAPVNDYYAEIRHILAKQAQERQEALERSSDGRAPRSGTPGGWSKSSSDFELIDEPDDVEDEGDGDFEHINRDIVTPDKAEPVVRMADADALLQLTQAITGLQNVMQDPVRDQGLADALNNLKDEMSVKDKDKELTETLKSLRDAVKAERADKDPSFKLDKFIHNKTDPYVWYGRLEQHAQLKKTDAKSMFPMVVDDETHTWFQTLTDTDDLRTKFLQEFGEEGDKFWDKRRSFQDLKQGALTAREFIRLVLSKARRVFNLKDTEKFQDGQEQEILTVLMNGFNDKIKTLVLTRKAETLDEVVSAAHDAKCLEVQPSSDTALIALKDAVERLEAKTMQPRDESPRRPSKSSLKQHSAASSPESSRESSPARGNKKKVSFKDAKTSPSSSGPPSPVSTYLCSICGNRGHTKIKCAMRSKQSGNKQGSKSQDTTSTACFQCGQEGHFRRNCPSKKGSAGFSCQICRAKDHKADKCPKRHETS